MTTDERLDLLVKTVDRFVKASTEFQVAVMTALKAQSRTLERHEASIRRLDAIIERWDRWLRGQGPSNGHKRR